MYKQTPIKTQGKGSERVTTSKRHNPRFASLASICNAFFARSLPEGTPRQPGQLPPSLRIAGHHCRSGGSPYLVFWKTSKNRWLFGGNHLQLSCDWLDHQAWFFYPSQSWWQNWQLPQICGWGCSFMCGFWSCHLMMSDVRVAGACQNLPVKSLARLEARNDGVFSYLGNHPFWCLYNFGADWSSTLETASNRTLANPACSLAGYKRSGAWITCKRFAWEMRLKTKENSSLL